MNTDNLDSLTDAQLSEVFAVEVAGFVATNNPDDFTDAPTIQVWFDAKGDRLLRSKPYQHNGAGRYAHSWYLCNFATSADAVLGYLPKIIGAFWTADGGGAGVCVCMRDGNGHIISEAVSGSFSRSACVALIKHNRATKGSE